MGLVQARCRSLLESHHQLLGASDQFLCQDRRLQDLHAFHSLQVHDCKLALCSRIPLACSVKQVLFLSQLRQLLLQWFLLFLSQLVDQ
jgi:hypothetical protein